MSFDCRCPHARLDLAIGGVFPHAQNNKDFALLVGLGMRPADVLRPTTSNAAALIGTTVVLVGGGKVDLKNLAS